MTTDKRCRLTPEQVDAIRLDPRVHAAIARDYGVSQQAIWKIKAGQTYKLARVCAGDESND